MKIFQISLVAMLAVTPFMAGADIAKQSFKTTGVNTNVSATLAKTVAAPTLTAPTAKTAPTTYKLATNTYVDGAYAAATEYTNTAVQNALNTLATNASLNQTVQLDIANALEDFLSNNMPVATAFNLTGTDAETQLFTK